MTENHDDGFRVPLHRSLTSPILVGGVPRKVFFLNAVLTMALIFGFRTLLILPFGVILHLVCVALSRSEPHFLTVFTTNISRANRWRS